MSESVILCEGYHDRAFWDGWLTSLGCTSDGFKPNTPGYPALDPWGDAGRGGQFGYRSRTGQFVRVQPCNGRTGILPQARVRLRQRSTRTLIRIVVNVDVDVPAGGVAGGPTGLRQQDVLYQVQQIEPTAVVNAEGDIEVDGGATKVALVRWETADPPGAGLPDEQTLERLVSAAIIAAYPPRAKAVFDWLSSRPQAAAPGPKEHAWSYMAGWYAEQGCEAFYASIWADANIAKELELRLRGSGAWQIAERMAT
jgi:hypothetical protein